MLDSITGLKNRIALEHDLELPVFPVVKTLVVVEIVDFERISILYGLPIANSVLIQFSTLLETFNIKEHFNLYRISSNIFALLSSEAISDTDEMEVLIPELFELIGENPLYIREIDDVLDIDVVAGIASGDRSIYQYARTALRHAKLQRKHYLFYTRDMDLMQLNRTVLQVKQEIKAALSAHAFVPVFQPIVNRERQLIKYECLVRMRRGEGSEAVLVSPDVFLEIAEETRQYTAISEAVIRQSIAYFADKASDFSINLTYLDIIDRKFMQRLKALVASSGIGHRMVLEIVESQSFEDYELLKQHLDDFKALGLRIAIDDFGTGYSNFSHILEVEPDYLKIDGSLIRDMLANDHMRILVEAIIQFAKRLGISLIAEYVHSEELFHVLYELGIDEFQGFYFGQPVADIGRCDT